MVRVQRVTVASRSISRSVGQWPLAAALVLLLRNSIRSSVDGSGGRPVADLNLRLQLHLQLTDRSPLILTTMDQNHVRSLALILTLVV